MDERKKSKRPEKEKKISLFSLLRERYFPFRHLIAIALIAGVAFAAYSNTFHAPFHFDDEPNITKNPAIQTKAITLEWIKALIKTTYYGENNSLRFFAYITFGLNYYFGGLNVFGYHLVNLIIHIGSGIFLYWFVFLTFNLPRLKEKYGAISYKAALFASLIFIVHPIQTQAVTYIVQRMASMAGMFYFLTLVLYIKGRLSKGGARWAYFGGMGLSYLLGLFTKENTAILPLFIALYEFYFFQNLDLSPKGKKVVYSLITILFSIVTFGVIIWGKRYFNGVLEGYDIRTFTMSERVLTQFRVVLYYVTLLIYPHPSRLNLDYDFSTSRTILDPPTTLLSILMVIGLIGFSLWTAKKRPVLSFFILWYFGNLAIESSIFPLEMVYEHRLYIPSAGPFILFSLLVIRVIERLREKHSSLKRVVDLGHSIS